MSAERIVTSQEEIRGTLMEVVDLTVPQHTGILKQDEKGNWYLSMPQDVVGGVVELRLYGPSRASLTRVRARGGLQRTILGPITEETYHSGRRVIFVTFQMIFATAATHVFRVHKRRRDFKEQEITLYYKLLPAPANGVIEVQTL